MLGRDIGDVGVTGEPGMLHSSFRSLSRMRGMLVTRLCVAVPFAFSCSRCAWIVVGEGMWLYDGWKRDMAAT